MLTHEQCYKKIGKSKIIHKLLLGNLQKLKYSKNFDFDSSSIEKELILSEPLIKEINKTFEIKSCGIIKLDPWKCYKWHNDALRGVSINLLLEPTSNSVVFFGEQDNNYEYQYHIVKFEYEPETFYLFNNQIPHTVFNFEYTRYLISISFVYDKSTLHFDFIKKIFN